VKRESARGIVIPLEIARSRNLPEEWVFCLELPDQGIYKRNCYSAGNCQIKESTRGIAIPPGIARSRNLQEELLFRWELPDQGIYQRNGYSAWRIPSSVHVIFMF
jgi:hypothetical protein